MAFSASSAPMMRTPSAPSFGLSSFGNSSSSIENPLSDLEQLVLFVLERGVDLGFVGVGELVELLLGARQLVFSGVAVLHQRVELVTRSPAQVADRDLAFFALVPDALDELLAALFGQLREHQADQLAVVRRVQTEIRIADGLLD